MTPEQILSIKPKILTQKQRESYFENGFILLEKILPDSWIEKLKAATRAAPSRNRTPPGTSTRGTRARARGCAASPA
jgi:ectoine hydroxylase